MPAELAAPWWAIVLNFALVVMLWVFVAELLGESKHTDPWPPGLLEEIWRSLEPPVPLVLAGPPLRPQPTYPDYDGWPVGNPQRQIGGAT